MKILITLMTRTWSLHPTLLRQIKKHLKRRTLLLKERLIKTLLDDSKELPWIRDGCASLRATSEKEENDSKTALN